jgi:hypothetical protein
MSAVPISVPEWAPPIPPGGIQTGLIAPATMPRGWLPSSEQCLNSHGLFVGLDTGLLTLAPCKQWTCAVCGRRLAWKFVLRATQHDFNWHITFTSGWQWTAENARRFNAACRQVMFRLRKDCGIPIEVKSWSNERGPHGQHVLHKHALVKGPDFIPYDVVRQVLDSCGLGRQFRARRVKSGDPDAVLYAAKNLADYAVKSSQVPVPRYSRRVWVRPFELKEVNRQWEGHAYRSIASQPNTVLMMNRSRVAGTKKKSTPRQKRTYGHEHESKRTWTTAQELRALHWYWELDSFAPDSEAISAAPGAARSLMLEEEERLRYRALFGPAPAPGVAR